MNGLEVTSSSQRTSILGQYLEWQDIKEKTLSCLRSVWHWFTSQNTPPDCENPKLFFIIAWDRMCLWLCSKKFMSNLFFVTSERYCMLKWVKQTIPKSSITNFREDWKDGIALCALVNALVPDTCPRYDLLDKGQELCNIELGLNLAQTHLKVKTDITVADFQTMTTETEKKLVRYFATLQSAYENHLKCKQNPAIVTEHVVQEKVDDVRNPTCFARGMGIILATKGEKACFNIYLHANNCMDIVVEIEGPENDFCTKRITVHSPRRTQNIEKLEEETTLSTGRQLNMAFEYEVMHQTIAVAYTPQNVGNYKVSIISRGQHIHGSPYTVRVDEASPNNKAKRDHSCKLLGIGLSRPESGTLTSYTTRFGEPISCDHPPSSSKIIRRKVLRSIVYRNGEQVILHGDEPLPPDPRAWSSGTSVQVYDSSNESTTSDCGNFDEECRSAVSTPTTEAAEYDLLQHSLPEDEQLINVANHELTGANSTPKEHGDPVGPHEVAPIQIYKAEPDALKMKPTNGHCDKNQFSPENVSVEDHSTNSKQTPVPDHQRQRCSSVRLTNGIQHTPTLPLTPRIPNELINEYGELWNADGESIVKTRVKALESNLQSDKQKSKQLSLSTSSLNLSNINDVQIKLVEATNK